jgi:hypothetical protein
LQTICKQQIAIPPDSDVSTTGHLLAAILMDVAWHHCDVTLVLSGQFVHYLLIPWNDGLLADDESEAFVRLNFINIYGERARNWQVRWSLTPKGQCVASAIDNEFLKICTVLMQEHGLRLVSVQPSLMTVVNRWYRHIDQQPCWFMLAEQDRVIVLLHTVAGWQYLHSQHIEIGDAEAVSRLLQREMLRAGDDNKITEILTAGHAVAKLDDRWQVKHLPIQFPSGFDPVSDVNYSTLLMAL